MHSASLLIALASVVAFVGADRVPDFVIRGQCPVIDEETLWEEQKPNHSKFGGTWFQYALTNNPYQPLEQCVQVNFAYDGESFDVTTTGITANRKLLKRQGSLGPMPLGDPHLMIALDESFPAPLVILDTDYSNYACLYSCIDNNFGYHSDFSFIFTRSPTPSDALVSKCENAFKDMGLDTSRLHKTVQGDANCPYDTQKTL